MSSLTLTSSRMSCARSYARFQIFSWLKPFSLVAWAMPSYSSCSLPVTSSASMLLPVCLMISFAASRTAFGSVVASSVVCVCPRQYSTRSRSMAFSLARLSRVFSSRATSSRSGFAFCIRVSCSSSLLTLCAALLARFAAFVRSLLSVAVSAIWRCFSSRFDAFVYSRSFSRYSRSISISRTLAASPSAASESTSRSVRVSSRSENCTPRPGSTSHDAFGRSCFGFVAMMSLPLRCTSSKYRPISDT